MNKLQSTVSSGRGTGTVEENLEIYTGRQVNTVTVQDTSYSYSQSVANQ